MKLPLDELIQIPEKQLDDIVQAAKEKYNLPETLEELWDQGNPEEFMQNQESMKNE